ncbi:membrane-associated protein, putative [Bodo saltans]|uniref:Membrane-associated protein, putative n=1 Tax=Bodo saltans TaxID=75058 RepID=A0A0S4JUZ3_BODSA|nr:membrane-associated protein, putative [Bodo saltans]|eukprot:CUG93869.1 membrane-associated protein, putative [Bodo saltans]
MLRRTNRRLGHQLIKEPLGNEENTYARGRRTFDHTVKELTLAAAVAGVGSLAAWWSIRNASLRHQPVVSAKGVVTRVA